MLLAGGQTDQTDLMYYKTEDALGRFGVETCLCKTSLSRLGSVIRLRCRARLDDKTVSDPFIMRHMLTILQSHKPRRWVT